MARIRNGILGGFSNKVGEVIGQNYAGVSTMRAMPKYVSNPRTPAQEKHREKMATAGAFLSAFTRGLSFSNFNKSAVSNGFNNALRENLVNFAFDNNDVLKCDLLGVNLGEYVGEPFKDVAVILQDLEAEDKYIQAGVEWNKDLYSDWCSPDDILIGFVVQEVEVGEYKPLYCDVLPAVRNDQKADIIIPCGDDVVTGTYIYFAFGAVAKCMYRIGHNPQKPSETIKIPSRNIVKSSGPSGPPKTSTGGIPAKNVVRFSAGATLKKAVNRKNS